MGQICTQLERKMQRVTCTNIPRGPLKSYHMKPGSRWKGNWSSQQQSLANTPINMRGDYPTKGRGKGTRGAGDAIRDLVLVIAAKAIQEDETPEMWAQLTAEEIDRLMEQSQAMEPTEKVPDDARALVYNQERKYYEGGNLIKRRLRAHSTGARYGTRKTRPQSGQNLSLGHMHLVTWNLTDFYLHKEHRLNNREYAYVGKYPPSGIH